jgi:hypothetical protein
VTPTRYAALVYAGSEHYRASVNAPRRCRPRVGGVPTGGRYLAGAAQRADAVLLRRRQGSQPRGQILAARWAERGAHRGGQDRLRDAPPLGAAVPLEPHGVATHGRRAAAVPYRRRHALATCPCARWRAPTPTTPRWRRSMTRRDAPGAMARSGCATPTARQSATSGSACWRRPTPPCCWRAYSSAPHNTVSPSAGCGTAAPCGLSAAAASGTLARCGGVSARLWRVRASFRGSGSGRCGR